jgi:hypothetical protein
MFTQRADDLWMYNLPHRPWLGIVEGVLFYTGLVLACWHWRRPQHVLALMWLVVGMLPSTITGVSASATRAVAILPVLYLFPAIAVTTCLKRLRAGPTVALGTVLLVLLGGGVRTYHAYFDVWSNAPDVRVAYHTTLFESARYLSQQSIPQGTVVVQSSIYPGRYHDPYALDLMLARHDLSLRWVDGRGALVFPASPSRLIVPALAPLDPALQQAIAPPYARLVESRLLRPDDLDPRFDVYDWDSAAAVEALLLQANHRQAAWNSTLAFPVDNPQSVYQALDLPADLGHTVALLGYDLSSQIVTPGDEIVLVTYWRVLSRPSPEMDIVLFTHLLTPENNPPVIAQQDRLDAPAWNWHLGESFAQVHRLAVGDNVATGLYPLEVGAYTRSAPSPIDPNPPAMRLALYIADQPVSDRILLPPIQVQGQAAQ